MKFYLGTHIPNWLWDKNNIPFFVSDKTLKKYKNYKPSKNSWALDSGGFTELNTTGNWNTPAKEYVSRVKRYWNELGSIDFIAIQDWMCEPFILAKTGKTIEYHQQRTVQSYIELKNMEPDLPFIPILQGFKLEDYYRCIDLYLKNNIDLTKLVGVGSVCRRQHTDEIKEIFTELNKYIPNMHGFGVKYQAIFKYGKHLYSSDSMAWSLGGRYIDCNIPGHTHKNKANCFDHALWYYNKMNEAINAQNYG